MIKKIFLFASIALMFASCENNDGDSQMSLRTEHRVAFHVSPEDKTKSPFFVYNVAMVFNHEYVNSTVTVSCSDLNLGVGESLSFKSEPVKFKDVASMEGFASLFEVPHISVLNNGLYNKDYDIDDMSCLHTDICYYPKSEYSKSPISSLVMMDFEVGEKYELTSFPLLAFYSGTTQSSYSMGGSSQSFYNDAPVYGVKINPSNSTADIVLYNAKFAEPMPELSMTLKGLSLVATEDGYIISAPADGIIPLVGVDEVPYPDYVFNKFVLTCQDDDLVEARISFQVAHMFNGEFIGRYTPIKK